VKPAAERRAFWLPKLNVPTALNADVLAGEAGNAVETSVNA
jgi:hypothetical protein